MYEHLLAVLKENLVPAVERLELEHLILPGESGKQGFAEYVPGEGDAPPPPPGLSWEYRSHPYLELAFGLHGRAEMALGGRRYALCEGEVALLLPNVPHLERILGPDVPYHLIWVRVLPDHLSVHGSSYSRGNRFQLLRGASLAKCGEITLGLEQAGEDAARRGTLWFTLVRARLAEGLIQIVRHLETHGATQNPEQVKQSVADVAMAFIQAHFSEDLALEQIAREVFLSPNYFSSIFSQAAGMTVFEYLQQVRLEEARRLLAGTDLPVGEVARRVGIRSASYFSRLFRRATGQAAGAYRRKAQDALASGRAPAS